MERTGPIVRLSRLLAACSAGLLADVDLVRNGGFEAGLDGWNCANSSGTAVTAPKRTGASALKADRKSVV